MANFVYLLVDEKSHEAAVVDSGWETEPIVRAATEAGAHVRYAVATHEHFDHTSTLRELAGRVDAKVVAHEDSPIDCDVRVADQQQLKVGATSLKVLHTPGHTRDSISLYDGRNVFTGDTLFVGTIGKFERTEGESIYRSLTAIMGLPGSTLLYPGHDYGDVRSRTLREEGQSNPFLMAGDLRSFLSLFS
jgi:hydroxyacylglutathione hydrolase